MSIAASPTSLKKHAEELLRLLDATPASAAVAPHIENLALSVFRSMRHWVDVRALDARIANWCVFDLSDVICAVELIERAPCEAGFESERESTLEWCRQTISALERQCASVDEGSVRSCFSTLNHRLEHALTRVPDRWTGALLVDLISKRLLHARPEIIRRAWRRASSECRTQDGLPVAQAYPFILDRLSPLRSKYFSVDDRDLGLVRDRLAKYVGWHRSRLLRAARARGPLELPDEVLGLARALSLRADYGDDVPSEWDWSIARGVGEIARVRGGVLSTKLWHAANELLGIDDDGPILTRFTPVHQTGVSPEKELLFHVLALLTACEAALGASHTLGQRLSQYKLRMELSAGEVLRDLAAPRSVPRTETRLQRDLCRFLIGHGIYAVGTKFGRAETDLVVAESADTHLIEAKIYSKPPTAKMLTAHFPQIETYADSFPLPPRTRSLVAFNYSDTYLSAPHTTLAGECILMFINLMTEPPNKRRKHLRFLVADGRVVADP